MKKIPGNLRIYGNPPCTVAVIHGGPGAAGEMAPVARELSEGRGVLEPLQTADSLDGQVEELRRILEGWGDVPVALVGYSWGAWLAYLTAAAYPALVKKLILVASGPFDPHYAGITTETRLNRLDADGREVLASLDGSVDIMSPETFARIGAMLAKADAFEPIDNISDDIDHRPDIFGRVWRDAAKLRKSGQLLERGRLIECPVVAIHGDYDPHPADGVSFPSTSLFDPWISMQSPVYPRARSRAFG